MPWKTVARALSAVGPGQSIGLRRGSTWLETVAPARSGTQALPITIGAYGTGDRPIISGAAVRERTLSLVGMSYFIVRDLDFRNANNSWDGSVYIRRAAAVQLINVSVHDNYAVAGVFVQDSNSVSIVGSDIYNNRHSGVDRGDGLLIDGTGGKHHVEGSRSWGNTSHGIRIGFIVGSSGNYIGHNSVYENGSVGISCQIGSANTVIEYNLVYSNGQVVADTAGIDLYKPGDNNSIRYNTTHDHRYLSLYAGGIRFDGGDAPGASPLGNVAYGNVIYNERIGINALNFDNASAINNTVYNSGLYGIHIHGSATAGFTAKNNLIHTAGASLIFNEDATGTVADYNLYYPDGASAFNWNGTTSNFANWKKTRAQDSHSINSDPMLTHAGSNDFTLQTGSPAIGAAVFVPGMLSGRITNIGAK